MKISVIIPAYNEEKFLPRTLMSLQNQNFTLPYEVIVVDNNSDDNTAEIARQYGAKVVFEAKRGASRATNAGFSIAKGEILARMDADTYVPPDWLMKIWKTFSKDKNTIALGGPTYPMETVWLENFIYYPGTLAWMYLLRFFRRGYLFFNIAMRRDIVHRIGGYDTNLFFGEDSEIVLRLKKYGKVKLLPSLYVYTSTRRLRSLGFIQYILGYTFANQLSLLKGKAPSIGLSPIRPSLAQSKIPKYPWLYLGGAPVFFILFSISTYASPKVNMQTSQRYFSKFADKEYKSLIAIQTNFVSSIPLTLDKSPLQ